MSQVFEAGRVKASNNTQKPAKHQIVTWTTEANPHTCENHYWIVKN